MKRKSKDSLNNDDDVDYMDIPLQVPDVEVRSDVDRPRKLSKAQRSLRRIDMMSMTREVGLSVPIGSDNKGYHLLTKFGYSEGGLGKDGTGISEPIAVTHRPPTVTVGIGIEREFKEAMKKKEIRFAELVARRDEITSAFKIAQTQRHEATKMSRELRKNRKIIVNLDRTRGIAPHVLWEEADIREALNRDMEPAVVSLEIDELDFHELVLAWKYSTEYLRSVHLYCTFCGCGYDDEGELANNCPGLTEDDH